MGCTSTVMVESRKGKKMLTYSRTTSTLNHQHLHRQVPRHYSAQNKGKV
jgi:hypothetical protein